MGTANELRREIAGERGELTEAVAELREELGHAAERGKKLGAGVAAAGSALVALRLLLRLRRRS